MIYSGSLHAKWAGADGFERMAELSDRVESNWTLMSHCRINLEPGNETSSLPADAYFRKLDTCEAGYAFYDPNHSRNMKYVGLAAGKVLSYLDRDLLLVMNAIPYWQKVIPKHFLGEVIRDSGGGSGLFAALDELLEAKDVARERGRFLQSIRQAAAAGLSQLSNAVDGNPV